VAVTRHFPFSPDELDQPLAFIDFEAAMSTVAGHSYPNEIGVCIATLRRGEVACFHRFIEPGELPIGSQATASYVRTLTRLLRSANVRRAATDGFCCCLRLPSPPPPSFPVMADSSAPPVLWRAPSQISRFITGIPATGFVPARSDYAEVW